MPAVVRGGRRQSQTPAPKAAPAKSPGKRGPRKVSGAAPKAFGRVPVSNEVRAWFAGIIITALLGVVLLTGNRAEAVRLAITGFADSRLADMGLKLNKIQLEGVSGEAEPAVKAVLKKSLKAGQPIALMDLKKLQAEIETIGWVKQATIRRQLPGLLVVSVVERPRLAVWQYRGKDTVIDDQGHIIPEAMARQFAGLPLVVGEGANESASAILQQLQTRTELMQKTYALVRVDTRRWDVHLKNGAIIKLPALNQEQALNRLDVLMAQQRVLDQGFAEIDLIDPEALVVVPIEARS